MSTTFTNDQLQANLDAIASPEEEVATQDRRVRMRAVDAQIKAYQFMQNTNRAQAGTRRRQTRLTSSKGF